jgi:hypothetical protein
MNKSGMSEVISTLLIVVITIAAVLLIWTAVKGNLQGGSVDIAKTKCASIDLAIDKCTASTSSISATLAGGEASKIVFMIESATDSGQYTATAPTIGKIIGTSTPVVVSPTKASAIAYVKADNGQELSCGVIAAQICA